jgi:hypothetical protein
MATEASEKEVDENLQGTNEVRKCSVLSKSPQVTALPALALIIYLEAENEKK